MGILAVAGLSDKKVQHAFLDLTDLQVFVYGKPTGCNGQRLATNV